MYLKFYHLQEIPFTLEPNPKYILANPNRETVLSAIIDSVHQKKNFIVLFGDQGSGKTIIMKSLFEKLSTEYRVKALWKPSENSYEFIEELFGLYEISESDNIKDDLFSKHQSHIKQILKFGGNNILILDDAHLLSPGIFDLIQLFLKNKIKIILSGRYELKQKLMNPEYGNLWSDIKESISLKNLSYEEAEYYIKYRFSIAKQSSDFKNPFSGEAIEAIFQYSKGLPRRINILCNNALVLGKLKSAKIIDREIIEKVKSDDICYHEIKNILQQKNG